MTRIGAALLAVAALAATALPAHAQGRPGAERLYDTSSVGTVSGTIVSVDTVTGPGAGTAGVHVRLSTGRDTTLVDVGPVWYLAQERITLRAGERLRVTGSTVGPVAARRMIAAQLQLGERTFQLRDRTGTPAWARDRGRRR